jgi:hypothetical protein
MRSPALTILLYPALLAALGGCASSGRSFATDKIPRIELGHTTSQQIHDWFGEPISVRTRGSGGSTWQYDHIDTETADTGMATRIGASLSRVFGGPWVRSPVNVAYSNTTRHRLVVRIDSDGLVNDYTYERTERPSKRVY